MNIDMDLLSTPLFIIKKLQRDSLRREASRLKGRVLDIGCGTRPYRRYIRCEEYVGIDSIYAVKPQICAIADRLPFKDSSFDAVICTEVIEHLEEPRECIAEIRRVLKDAGLIYITAPQSWPLHYEPYDYWRFTKYGLGKMLTANGFKMVSINRIGGPCTLIGQEMLELASALMKKFLSFMPAVWAEKISAGLCAPIAVMIYLCGKIFDGADNRYAFGWAVVAVR